MAKQKSNVIALELEKFETKIVEFQTYLEDKNINDIYDDVARAKEIDIQLKLMNAIPFLLDQLAKLREVEVKKVEARGGAEIGGFAEQFIKKL